MIVTDKESEIKKDEELEVLEIEELSRIQALKRKITDFFRVKKHVAVSAISVAMAVIMATVLVIINVLKPDKTKPVTADIQEVTEQTEEESTSEVPMLALYLEAVADENNITAKVYGEDGEVLTGHELVFNLLKGSKEENAVQIDMLKETRAGQQIEGVEAAQYPDDDRDGTVEMCDLETGTYTLVVQAEEGYTMPEAAETTVETFQIIENIMEKVVVDTAATQKEDPSKNRGTESTGENVKPVTYVDNAVTGSVGVTSVKKSGGSILYTLKSRKSILISKTEIGSYKAESLIIDGQQYKGYIYETGTVDVTGGSENVVTKFLVKDESETGQSQSQSESSVGSGTVNSTSDAAKDSGEADKASESSTVSEKESEADKTRQTYFLMEIEAQIETVYADGWQNVNGKNYYFENSQAVTGWKKIDGAQYYFNADGSQGSSLVIDVSTYNGDIDWYSVKASGINYAIIRVGYRGYETANLVKDKRFDYNMSQATAAGIKVGAYIVTQAVNTSEAVEEASFIVSACSGYNVSLPLIIDVESAGGGRGRGDKISTSERTAVINAFAQTVNSCGYSAMVYANKDWMENRINAGNISCNVWLAQYRSTCTYTGPFAMWQFTDSSYVNGISGKVDMSAWKHNILY
ncbi:MAG: GH25 family lysozyme [Lachnospira sp.]